MGAHTNCESITRRDGLRLGLGALIGGGLIDALRLRGMAVQCRSARRRDELHPDLDGRRAEPLRDVRPQARRARRDPGQVGADRHQGSRDLVLAAHDAAGHGRRTSWRSSARSATTRGTMARATIT